jgi:hypothetical protein
MKFVGVKQFKEDTVKYLNEGNEIVAMKRKEAHRPFWVRVLLRWGGQNHDEHGHGGEDLRIRENRLEKERHGTNSSQY